MLKLFYYPTYFRIRQWGANSSLIFATAFVFFLTWFFHAYQWFWLRCTFLLTTPDILFWLILACLVIINTLYEAKRGRKRALGQQTLSAVDIAALALQTTCTFIVMATLWSLWSSDSIRDWIALISVVELTTNTVVTLMIVFGTITAAFGLAIWIRSHSANNHDTSPKQAGFSRPALVNSGLLLLLFIIGNPVVYSKFGGQAQEVIGDLTVNRLSDREAALLQRGYYEDLIGVNRFNSQLWEIYSKRPSDWPTLDETEAARQTGDNLIVELVPSTSINFHGEKLTITAGECGIKIMN
jgi:hypothetical protein